MDKRLAKRHKRQVARKREHLKVSLPDVRTPEEIAAAKVISHADLRRDTHAWPSLPSDAEASEKSEGAAAAPAETESA